MSGTKLIFSIAVALVATAAVAHAQPGAVKHPVTATVEVHDNFFDPRSASVAKGESVRWAWKDDNKHNVVFKKVPAGASKRRIKSRNGGQVTRSFAVAGSYRYVCTLYDGMEGMVTVTP